MKPEELDPAPACPVCGRTTVFVGYEYNAFGKSARFKCACCSRTLLRGPVRRVWEPDTQAVRT